MKTKVAPALALGLIFGIIQAISFCLPSISYGAMFRVIWDNGNGTGLFTDNLNWNSEDIPVANHTLPGNFLDVGDDPSTMVDSPIDDTTNAVIQHGGSVTLNRDFTAANPFDNLIVRIGSGLNISADLTATTRLHLSGVDGHSDFINQTAGTVSVSRLKIGPGTGTYRLRGGELTLTSGMTIENDSTFSLQGDTASVSASFLTLSQATMESPTLEFQFGAGGVNPIALMGLFTIDSTYAGLTIDGSSYTGGARTIALVSYSERSGSFAETNIRISDFKGLIGTIKYDADSMILVLSPKPSEAKPAVPDAVVREEARAAIEQSHELEIRQANNQQQKQSLTRKLIKDGENAKDNLAIQYESFRIARDIAIDVGDVTLAMECVAHTVSSFNVDAVRLKASALNALTKGRRTQSLHEELVDHFDAVIDDALAADRFDIATPLVKIALTSARKTGNKKIIKTASQRSKDITQMEEAYEKVKEALAALETNPVDPGANTVAGKYLCFHKGDWERGLSYLALGEEGDSRDLARTEIAKSSDYLALGNGWWEIARSFDKRRADVIRLHAASNYQRALPKLEGLTRTKIEDRLRGLGDTDDP